MADPALEEDLVQLENLTPEVSIHIKQELQECVVCIAESTESFDIYNTHTASGMLLHTFLRKLTDTDIPSSPEYAKYICKICLYLVNDLEKAEMEYNKLKETFKSIISKNPLFSSIICEKSKTDTPQCSQICVKDIKKEIDDGEKSNSFQTTIKLEPLTDDDNCKEYEIQYTETKWGTVLVSRKGDELVQERPAWAADVQGGTEPPPVAKTKDTAPVKRQKPRKLEVEIPANMIILENGEKGFQCSICQRQFKQKGNYNRHVSTHTGIMPFECTICQRRFKRKDHLLNHVRTHTGEKPFECNFCLLKFNQKGSIIKHIRTHTGQEPFECNICQRRFKQRPHLNSHIRIHTGDKPYECKICQRRFIESSKLKIHLRTHTGEKPYECTYCNRHFNQRGNLQSHLRTHTGEKPYECTVCQRRFNLKHHLRDHISTHTGEKPYECSVCKQKFNYKHVLQNHLRVMHPPEVFQELYGTDAPNFEDNVNSDSNVEESVHSEGNFDDAERNLEVDVDSKAFGVNTVRYDVNSEGSVHDESNEEVSVEPSIEVTVKAEPMDFTD